MATHGVPHSSASGDQEPPHDRWQQANKLIPVAVVSASEPAFTVGSVKSGQNPIKIIKVSKSSSS